MDEAIWKRNCSSLTEWSDKVLSVLEDQASSGQVLKLTETDARTRFPNLVVASLGAQRKDKPNGVVSARVRAPVAADLERVMREKSLHDELTFALTADVSEAHRQIPIAPCDWHLLGCQVEKCCFGLADDFHLEAASCSVGLLCVVRSDWFSALLEQDSWWRHRHMGRVWAPPPIPPAGNFSKESGRV